MTTEWTTEEAAFQLILHAGNAKSSLMEGMYLAREDKFDEARAKLAEAKEELSQAHSSQTKLIQTEASGEKFDISILLIHAQDHLMNAMTMKELVEEIIILHEKCSK